MRLVELLTACCLLASACALPGGTSRIAATHHVDADRAVVPRHQVSGQAKKLCGVFFVNWGAPDAELMSDALADALEDDPKAELLVNAQTDASIYTVPLIFSRCRVFVTGTSATTSARPARPARETHASRE